MVSSGLTAAQQRRGDPARVAAFSDGVFAIVITILVLEIGVPAGLTDRSLAAALEEVWPELVAWVISFLLTGMYWAWHRDLFNQVRYVDRGVVWLNLLFLLPAALIPFAASVLGKYPTDAIGLTVYGAVLLATVLMRWLLYAYLTRRPALLWETPTSRQRRIGGAIAMAPVPVYVLAMAVSPAAPAASLGLYLSMPLLYFVLITALRSRPETRDEAEDYG